MKFHSVHQLRYGKGAVFTGDTGPDTFSTQNHSYVQRIDRSAVAHYQMDTVEELEFWDSKMKHDDTKDVKSWMPTIVYQTRGEAQPADKTFNLKVDIRLVWQPDVGATTYPVIPIDFVIAISTSTEAFHDPAIAHMVASTNGGNGTLTAEGVVISDYRDTNGYAPTQMYRIFSTYIHRGTDRSSIDLSYAVIFAGLLDKLNHQQAINVMLFGSANFSADSVLVTRQDPLIFNGVAPTSESTPNPSESDTDSDPPSSSEWQQL